MLDDAAGFSFTGRTLFQGCGVNKAPPRFVRARILLKNMSTLSRREFIKRTSVAGSAAALSFPFVGRVLGSNERINVACIGAGGKGDSDSSDAAGCGANIVALVDVDQTTLDKKGQQFPKARKFNDYRKLFDTFGDQFDAVTV